MRLVQGFEIRKSRGTKAASIATACLRDARFGRADHGEHGEECGSSPPSRREAWLMPVQDPAG